MVRVSKNLQFVVTAVLCTALAGCSSDSPSSSGGTAGTGGGGNSTEGFADGLKVRFSPMYSAFDGVHDYKVPATIDQAQIDQMAIDPIDVASINWIVDDKMVAKEPFPEVPGAVLLTTKASGSTTITATGVTKAGMKFKGTSTLMITKASADEWELGQKRYDNGVMINFMMLMPGTTAAGGTAAPNPMAILDAIPREASCANCHNNTMGLTVEHSPLQTAGYSDDELIAIFTTGAKPMGATFNSPFLKQIPAAFVMPIYKMLHTWTISAEVQRGVVFKLRSITPKVQPEIDLARLRGMFMGMGAAAGGAAPAAAAGSAAPASGAAGGS
jgi:hypothetical protein